MPDPESQPGSESTELVALIHGLAAHPWLMKPMAWRLRQAGFQTENFGYPSLTGSIESHAERFFDLLDRIGNQGGVDQIHIVAHSMGSIITRHMLQHRQVKKLQRIVMLAPPNSGSPAATRLSEWLPQVTTLGQLTDRPDSFVRQLDSPQGVEVGVVEASYDFVIPESSGRLPTQKDHITVFGGHNGLLVRPAAALQTIAFLRTGRFLHAAEAGETETG